MAIVRIDSLRTLGFAGISGTYAAIGAPTAFNWRMFRVINNTDGDMIISVDGTTDNLFVPAFSFVLYDCSTNVANVKNTDTFVIALKTQFYVKQSTAATKGSVWVEGVYAKGV